MRLHEYENIQTIYTALHVLGLRKGRCQVIIWPRWIGLHMCTLVIDKRSKGVSWSKTLKDISVELFFETQEHEAESLVMWIITSR